MTPEHGQDPLHHYDCFNDRPSVEPYADISGIGFLVGYLGTAYVVILILTGYYLAVFDPTKDPYRRSENQGDDGHNADLSNAHTANVHPSGRWKPNPADVAFLGVLRWPFSRVHLPGVTEKSRARLETAFNTCVLTLCDVQIATGIGILLSAYASLGGEEGISVYHWLIVTYFAWFASLTHLSGLSFLRKHLERYPHDRNWRLVFMGALFVLLFVAQVPTVFFGTATYPSYTRCFFSLSTAIERLEALREPHSEEHYELIYSPSIVSLVILGFSFIPRVVKVSRRMSNSVKRFGHWWSGVFQATIRYISLFPWKLKWTRNSVRSQRLWEALVARPVIALFLTCRLYIDLATSMLSEVFWLWISGLWGTVHLAMLRHFVYLDLEVTAAENHPTFGQVHPIFLLALPFVPVLVQAVKVIPELWREKPRNERQDSVCSSESDNDSTACTLVATPRSDLEYLPRSGPDGGCLMYSAPWSTPIVFLAKAQAVFFTAEIFSQLFHSFDLTEIFASLLAWIVLLQALACYMVILVGITSRDVGYSWLPRWLARKPIVRACLSLDGPRFWWFAIVMVFAGYSLSPLYTSGRYFDQEKYSPVLHTLYRDHLSIPMVAGFQVIYTVFVGTWLIIWPGTMPESVKESEEK